MARPLDALMSRRPAAVFMDCDGVIFDTNQLKCDAFRYALDRYPRAAVEALVDWHKRTGGVSRYLKIEHFFRELNPVPDVAAASARALTRFGEFCERGYEAMQPRSEALAFAALAGGPDCVWVVSGSDEEELRGVFRRAGIADRFVDVHGSPVGKRAHLSRILAARGVAPAQALFIGDGGGDWETAEALGVPFVFLAEMSEWRDGRAAVAESGEAPAAIAETWAALTAAARRGWGAWDAGPPPGSAR